MYSNNIKSPKTATEIVCGKCGYGQNIISRDKDTLIDIDLEIYFSA